MGMLDDAVLRARLRAGTDLIMFRKVLLTLDGVLADVSAQVSVDELLPSLFLRRLAVRVAATAAHSAPFARPRDPPVERGPRLADDAPALDPGSSLARERA